MGRTLFLAGATGVIGTQIIPLLIGDGWRVVGMTRSREKAAGLGKRHIEAVCVDVFDAPALIAAVAEAKPEVVIHQLTDLPARLDPARMAEALPRNARIRDEGTRNLIEAALRAGVRRFVAQSIAFAYQKGSLPHRENDPLNVNAAGLEGVTARGLASLEAQVMAAPIEGLVLRYGRLYGPGTGFDAPSGPGPLHVGAAASAAAMAAIRGAPGIYNIAEDDGSVDSEKAKQELQWSAACGHGA